MSGSGGQDLSGFSMLDLFRQETETQAAILNEGLLVIEQDPTDQQRLEALMRAAHSLKGAARIVGLDAAVKVAHSMEDCFVAAQKGEIVLQPESMDILLTAVDTIVQIAKSPETEATKWQANHQQEMDGLLQLLASVKSATTAPEAVRASAPALAPALAPTPAPAPDSTPPPASASAPATDSVPSAESAPASHPAPTPVPASSLFHGPPAKERPVDKHTERSVDGPTDRGGRTVRVSSENLNSMLSMISESLVQARWFDPFARELLHLKARQTELVRNLDDLSSRHKQGESGTDLLLRMAEVRQKAVDCRQATLRKLEEFEQFSGRATDLAERLYREAITSRMRPFADGVSGFPRMVRDLARQQGKKVRLEIVGQKTGVDREILEKLEAPLTHMLRNSVDHGIETPAEREAKGKRPEATIRLEARHQAGQLHITVSDDGRGIELDAVRRKAVEKGICPESVAAQLPESEILDFLFLPGFSTAAKVTEISGRGVGMDIVRSLAQEVGGVVRIETKVGRGSSVFLQLPITISVLRALLVEIGGEPYALPLVRINHVRVAPGSVLQTLEGRLCLVGDGRQIGLVDARDVLELTGGPTNRDTWTIVEIGEAPSTYGIIVDRFLGECKLVVRPLESRLGKVPDVNSAALLDDGTLVLILDVEDLVRSIDNLLSVGHLRKTGEAGRESGEKVIRQVLVADDSITVREMVRKLLENRGYVVHVAVDGMDAWNRVRLGHYDLIVSDVDMPRMNGIELVRRIKADARLQNTPVMIVSYKDREEDRLLGLEAGANYYLTKSSFHDESFLKGVVDLIGEP